MKKLITIVSTILIVCSLLTTINANDVKVIDEANVLSKQEEEKLDSLLKEFVDYTGYDIVVYFADKRSDYFDRYQDAITRLADDTFDYNGYGLGTEKEGLILCGDLYYRDYTITTRGEQCIDTYTNKALERIYNEVTPLFREDRYYDGALAFLDGAYYAYDNYFEFHEKAYQKALAPAIIGSSLITLITFIVLYSKLKSTKAKKTADNYMKNPRFNILRNGEIYLYTTIIRTKIVKSTPSGSSTHISSSGAIHGGGGSHKF